MSQKLAYIKKKQYLCGVKGKIEREITMEAIVYKTEEERLEALRRMVGLRKIWEAHVRELMAKHPEMLVAQ